MAWLQELRRISEATNILSEMRLTIDRIERRWPTAGDQVLFDNKEQEAAQSDARNLKMIVAQIEKPGGPDAAQALDAYIGMVSAIVDNATQQADIQEAPQ